MNPTITKSFFGRRCLHLFGGAVVAWSPFVSSCGKSSEKQESNLNDGRVEVGVKSLAINSTQVSALEDKALKENDADAALRLAKHYLFYENDEPNGVRWLKVADSSGSRQAKDMLSSMGYR